MVAVGRESSKNETKAPPGSARPESVTADSVKVNPFWQSLAMRSGILQPKLTVGQADDPYEREADRVADQVMRMPAPPLSGNALSITPFTDHQAQRKCAECEKEKEVEGALQRKESGGETLAIAPPIVHQAMSSPGQPLDAETRAYFEPRFGHDFSQVRVHTDAKAADMTRAVNARAFTVGKDVVFGSGQHSPHTPDGRRLLAHELAHTIQQKRQNRVQRLGGEDDAAVSQASKIYSTYSDDLTALGSELYRLTSESKENIGVVNEVLDLVSWLYIDDVAYYFIKPLTEKQLLEIASSQEGRDLLSRLRGEMAGWISTGVEQDEISKIDKALSAPSPDKKAQEPSVIADPERIKTIVNEVLVDHHIDPTDWKRLFSLDPSTLESELESRGVADAEIIAFIATDRSSLLETVRNGYVAQLEPGSLSLLNEPLVSLVDAVFADLSITLEELRILRTASRLRPEKISAVLEGFPMEASVRRNLLFLIDVALSISEDDDFLPIKLDRKDGGGLSTEQDIRIQMLQGLLRRKVWNASGKKLVRDIMKLDTLEAREALLQAAGLEIQSAKLIAERFFDPNLRDPVSELDLLELHFVENQGKWSLTEDSIYDLRLPWNTQLISNPKIVEEELTMQYTGATETVSTYQFHSGKVEDAQKLRAELGKHPIEILIAMSLVPKKGELLDELDYVVLLVPFAHSRLINKVEFDPGAHPQEVGGKASAFKDEGKIVVYNGQPLKIRDFLHEVGHLVAAASWEGFLVNKWMNAIKKDRIGVSLYGLSSPGEDFAESNALYWSGGKDDPESRRRYANRFAILDELRTAK